MLAEFGTGQVFWSMVWFFLFFLWIMILFQIFGDLFRDADTSGAAKVLWVIFLIITPYLGAFIYLIVRGRGMTERSIRSAQAQEAAFQDYVRQTAGSGGSAASELTKLAELHTAGKLTDEEFAAAKAKLI